MKKYLITIISLLFLLVSCGDQTSSDKAPPTKVTAKTPQQQAELDDKLIKTFQLKSHNSPIIKLEQMKVLLEQGANPKATDDKDKAILILAIEEGDVEAMRLLLEAGADPKVEDPSGKTALQYAESYRLFWFFKRTKSADMVKLLEQYMEKEEEEEEEEEEDR